ncbi:hypothetical protein ABIA30_003078 [Mycobacterium sp. MAA66]
MTILSDRGRRARRAVAELEMGPSGALLEHDALPDTPFDSISHPHGP